MTPKRIADISEPIEQLYSDLTDELLINIAKHLSKSTATWSALHEIETLEEMGQLTQENIEIINTYVARMPQEIKDAMNESRLEALGEIEQKLADAAKDGYITTPVSDSTVDVMQGFSAQAATQLNLVNQTMLNSSLEQYRSGVYEYRQAMNNAAIKTIETEQQLQQAQKEINIAAGKVVAGTDTRTKALRKCIDTLNNAGIVGYYDRRGRAWSAEAYVNMDIRTTVHNTYIQTVKERQSDYGCDVFQVSSHAGARPLCYPYQGKLYSWGSTGGIIPLGDGRTYRFEPISATSYGEPAGLFGINCGHVPYPMIPNVSELAKEEIQPKEENDREYQESQEQRALERQIRHAKRNVEMLGDLATDEDKRRIAEAQAKMREFIKDTGRTRRYDREQVATKRTTPPTAARPTVKTPVAPTNVTTVSLDNKGALEFKPATTREDAIMQSYEYADKVNFSKQSKDNINLINEELAILTQKYPIKKLELLGDKKMKANAHANYKLIEVSTTNFNNAKRAAEIDEQNRAVAQKNIEYFDIIHPDKKDMTQKEKKWYKEWTEYLKYKRGGVTQTYGGKATIAHEYGHVLSDQYFGMINKTSACKDAYSKENIKKREMVVQCYKDAKENGDIYNISHYANTDADEFFAEVFSAREMGEVLPDYIDNMLNEVLKNEDV